ncbi:MAG: recombinase family protein [Thermoplasmata archaeon]
MVPGPPANPQANPYRADLIRRPLGWDALRAAIYARVSTEAQAQEGFSLEAQREKLQAYCEARGWVIADRYVDDGYSGREKKRPAYRRMLEERDRWDTILVMKMDRIHRNSRNFMEMMDRLRGWGKEFNSVQESLDTGTAMGRFVMDIIQRIAQLESEQIAERVYMGMRQKAKAWQSSLGAPTPYGYRRVHGRLVVHEEQAPRVREIFRRALDGEPITWIAERLNRRGRRTNRGRTWSVWSVRYILQNTVYAGYVLWDDLVRPGDHEPLVSPTDFLHILEGFLERSRSEERGEAIRRVIEALESVEEDAKVGKRGVAEHAV